LKKRGGLFLSRKRGGNQGRGRGCIGEKKVELSYLGTGLSVEETQAQKRGRPPNGKNTNSHTPRKKDDPRGHCRCDSEKKGRGGEGLPKKHLIGIVEKRSFEELPAEGKGKAKGKKKSAMAEGKG